MNQSLGAKLQVGRFAQGGFHSESVLHKSLSCILKVFRSTLKKKVYYFIK